VPTVNVKEALKLYRALHSSIQSRLVASCHDCSEGGLAVAAAEVAFAGGFGMELDISNAPTEGQMESWRVLFSESNSRFVVTVSSQNEEAFEVALSGCPFAKVGSVTDDGKLTITAGGEILIAIEIDELKEAWKAPLRW
jgi:phosphoribosylformylglycinamidine synthase